jgi:hypothetical protein
MGNIVYAKDAAGKIKETAIVERVFDLEEVKKFKIQIEIEKKKTQEDFNKRMAMIIAEEKKINEILSEAEKLGIIAAEVKAGPVIATDEQVEASIKAEAAIEEKIV